MFLADFFKHSANTAILMLVIAFTTYYYLFLMVYQTSIISNIDSDYLVVIIIEVDYNRFLGPQHTNLIFP